MKKKNCTSSFDGTLRHLLPLPPRSLPLAHGPAQRPRRPDLVAPEAAAEEPGQQHGAVGVLLGEADLGVAAALLLGEPERLGQEGGADAGPAVPELRGPGADDAPPAAQVPGPRPLGGVGLHAQDEGADEGALVPRSDDGVLLPGGGVGVGGGGVGAGAQPRRPVRRLGEAHVAARQPARREKVHGDEAAGEEEEMGAGTAGQGAGEGGGGGQAGEAGGVEDKGAGGAGLHLGYGVGDEVQRLALVVGRGQGLEDEVGDVIVGGERFGEERRGRRRAGGDG